MANKFTITRTYDRDEIIDTVNKSIEQNGTYHQIKSLLDTLYTGWFFDIETACEVELILREKGDFIREFYQERLDEMNAAKKFDLV